MRSHHFGSYVTLDRTSHASREVYRVITGIIDFAFGLLYGLLCIRLLLDFFGARREAGFVQFIRSCTEFFYAPFRGMFASEALINGGHVIVWSLVVALLVYMVLHAAIRGLLSLIATA
jgi:uncharacterized protein YggT (Ycf19 family)